MKICIPTNGRAGLKDVVSEHFGRAATYTIVDTETSQVTVIDNRGEHMGGQGKPPEQIATTGAEVLICSGLGPRAIAMLSSFGIATYVGAMGTVQEAIDSFMQGRLVPASEDTACKNHRH